MSGIYCCIGLDWIGWAYFLAASMVSRIAVSSISKPRSNHRVIGLVGGVCVSSVFLGWRLMVCEIVGLDSIFMRTGDGSIWCNVRVRDDVFDPAFRRSRGKAQSRDCIDRRNGVVPAPSLVRGVVNRTECNC